MLMAGDVGGTKTRLAVYADDGDPIPEIEEVYPSDDFAHLEDIVSKFVETHGVSLSRAVFGMPGPVNEGVVKVTNLPWTVSEKELKSALGVSDVKLLNDLEATAFGVPFLPDEDLFVLNDAEPDPTANRVVIAPGTGLGEAILFRAAGKYYASASEGGHTDFAPRTPFEIGLLQYMLERFDHVSYERVCSGLGIPYIYAFIQEHARETEVPAIAEALAEADDPTRIIGQAAIDQRSQLCVDTMEAFIKILASEAGNMALNTLAKGGVYLGGGIPPKILPLLKDGKFMATFTDKGRFSEMLSNIPVYVIQNEKTALFGAACYALGMEAS